MLVIKKTCSKFRTIFLCWSAGWRTAGNY